MLNFTVGPVMADEETLSLGAEQIPYFRTEEFSDVMKESERLVLEFAQAPKESRAVFLTGSGTAAMEAAIINLLSPADRALVIVGGSFGKRFSQICDVHGIPHDDVVIPFGSTLTASQLDQYENAGYSALLVNIHETSTGVLYDAGLLSDFCKRNNLLFIMDAISAFLAEDLHMENLKVDAFITGSQKALACPPGVSVVALSHRGVQRVMSNCPQCLYFDLKLALKDGERGQTPFTPAVGTLLQINSRLRMIERNGGLSSEIDRVRTLAHDFRSRISSLPLEEVSPSPSNAVTALHPLHVSARDVFLILKDEYGIWVCPNGGELAETVFRVGHIGCLTTEDNAALVSALEDMNHRGLL